MKLDDFHLTAYLPMLKLIPSIKPDHIKNSTIANSPDDLQALNYVLSYIVGPPQTQDPNTISFSFYKPAHNIPSFNHPLENQPELYSLQLTLLSYVALAEVGFFVIDIGKTFQTIELSGYTSTSNKTKQIHIKDHPAIRTALQELRFPYQI